MVLGLGLARQEAHLGNAISAKRVVMKGYQSV